VQIANPEAELGLRAGETQRSRVNNKRSAIVICEPHGSRESAQIEFSLPLVQRKTWLPLSGYAAAEAADICSPLGVLRQPIGLLCVLALDVDHRFIICTCDQPLSTRPNQNCIRRIHCELLLFGESTSSPLISEFWTLD
jgi:hypothetical protein